MSDKSKILSILAMGMAMMPHTNNPYSSAIDGELDGKHIPPVIPPKHNGTKEYFFNSHGEFNNHKMLKTECVFICYAINDKNAIKKFNKWKNQTI